MNTPRAPNPCRSETIAWMDWCDIGWRTIRGVVARVKGWLTGGAGRRTPGRLQQPLPAEADPPREKSKTGDAAAAPSAGQPAGAVTNVNWKLLGASVRGASHNRDGLPNQDAFGWWPDSGEGLPVILAVADGHGSAARAAVGSQFAVEVALQTLRDFAERLPDPLDLTSCKREAEDRLPIDIERDWKKMVEHHLEQCPLLPGDFETTERLGGLPARKKLEDYPLSAYGTTLVTVLVAQAFVIGLQVGDGDLLVVTESGEALHPIPDNPLHFANVTTSLCQGEAWKNTQVLFQAFSSAPPALFLLATDGYKNAHRSLAGFLRTGREFADRLQQSGPAEVAVHLPEWLGHASEKGSGDDITVGLAWRTNTPPLPALPAPEPLPPELPRTSPEVPPPGGDDERDSTTW